MTDENSRIWVSSSLKKTKIEERIKELQSKQPTDKPLTLQPSPDQNVFYLASLARMLGLESKNAVCFSILIFKQTLYFAKNNATIAQDSDLALLTEFKEALATENNLNKIKERIWKKVIENTQRSVRIITNNFPKPSAIKRQKMSEGYEESLKDQIRTALDEFSSLLENDHSGDEKEKLVSSALWEQKAKLEQLFLQFVKKEHLSNTLQAKKCFSFFAATLPLDDYHNVFEDLENFKEKKKSQLETSWSAIKAGKFIFVSNPTIKGNPYRHSELAIVQYVYDNGNRDKLKELFNSGTLSEGLENHLVSSLWQCFSCWNTFDIGSKYFSQESSNGQAKEDSASIANLNPRHGWFYKFYKTWTSLYLEENDDTKGMKESCDNFVKRVIAEGINFENKFTIQEWNVFNNLLEKNLEIAENSEQSTEVILDTSTVLMTFENK